MATYKLIGASKPEAAIYYALKRLGEPFSFQTSMMGGREVRGGTVTDFLLSQYALIISVIGFYWHNTPTAKARDRIQRIALTSQGYTVIYIDEQDALENPDWYAKEAIRKIDHSRYKEII